MELYREDGEPASLFDMVRWFNANYPRDIFTDHPIADIRDKLNDITVCLCTSCRFKIGCFTRSRIMPRCENYERDLEPVEMTIANATYKQKQPRKQKKKKAHLIGTIPLLGIEDDE